ncbi:hypothetical protein ACFE04_010348 [Oxalis oulophora]
MENPGESVVAVIMVGGPTTGTTFRPVSFNMHKPLFPIAGQPMVHHPISACKKIPNLARIFLIGFYEEREFALYVSSISNELKVPVRYLKEDKPHGSAGALLYFKDVIMEDNPSHIFLLNHDVCCNFPLPDMLEAHKKHGGLGTILVIKVSADAAHQFGELVADPITNELLHYTEKPETFVSDLINCGVYVFTSVILTAIEKASIDRKDKAIVQHVSSFDSFHSVTRTFLNRGQPIDFVRLDQDILSPLAGKKQLYTYETMDFWEQIKTPGMSLKCSALYLAQYRVTLPKILASGDGVKKAKVVGDVYIHPSAKVHPTAKIGPNVSISANVRVGPGVRLIDCIILDDVQIMENALVINSIVGWKSSIGRWSRVQANGDYNAKLGTTILGTLISMFLHFLGEAVTVEDEVVVTNSIVLPNKTLNEIDHPNKIPKNQSPLQIADKFDPFPEFLNTMPFSSYFNINRRAGGGATGEPRAWTSSLLPSTATKSKSPSRKSRKPKSIINFFTIALTISILFFLLTLYLFIIAKPFSSTRSYRSYKSSRKPVRRKAVDPDHGNNSGAIVDITTKRLYDKIEFRDVDGGAWKQGWNVSYRGDEWDDEKLKVFVVPHSHNDPGWKYTVDEYYEQQTRHILDNIVETLSKDVRRKFIWEEMSYLEKWWRDASDEQKESFTNLVKNGQLEIVGGGWVMNDEANSHYYAIIEQITEGNLWLNENIGVIPKNSWAIDPFGYSPTMAYILRRMGFENMLIHRTHYELKKELALHKNLEYVWRQSWDAEESTDIFVHMMPFYSYDIPHTCGPEPAVCCQFDFARMRGRGFLYEFCPWGEHPVETDQNNVQERAMKILDQYRKKSILYRTNTVLIPLGDDFRYVTMNESEIQFRNYQVIFDYINSNQSLNAEAKFGTLEDYFRTLREESDRINYSRPGEIGSGEIEGFPSLSGDFFTYADRQDDYWSGYYVSRPFFKAVDRVLEHILRASEMMMAFLLGYCQRPQCERLPMSYGLKLQAARRNLALFQHHDGVTGTARDHVVRDYGNRMHTSLEDLQIFISKAIEVLIGIRHEKSDQIPSSFEPEQVRSKYDARPVYKAISAREGTSHSVAIFNSLEQKREEIVTLVVNRADITVLDSNWSCLPSQVSPELQHNKSKIFTGRHRVHWKASVPPLGVETYYIANGFAGCEKAKPAKLKFLPSSTLHCPPPYSCSKIEGDLAEIRNQHQTLTFNVKNGLLQKLSPRNGAPIIVGEEIDMYSSSGSGAYLFKPSGDAKPIVEESGQMVISEGFLMQELFSYPKTLWQNSPVSHSTRIYDASNNIQQFLIEKEYHVELIGADFNDKELIARYKTSIDNQRIFYSDLNGFQMSRRETYDKIPVQGNYYPMPYLAFMEGSNGQRFSVHTRQSLGVAGLENGWLEIMLDRRLLRDDARGLGQGITDNREMNVVFHLLLESNISSVSDHVSDPLPLNPSILSHRIGSHLNYPLLIFLAKRQQELNVRPSLKPFSPLSVPLPCDLHIVTFKIPRPLKFSQQLAEEPRFVLMLQRLSWDSSFCRKGRSHCLSISDEPLRLHNLFNHLSVLNARATSLNLLHEDTEMLGYTEQPGDFGQERHIIINPMESIHEESVGLKTLCVRCSKWWWIVDGDIKEVRSSLGKIGKGIIAANVSLFGIRTFTIPVEPLSDFCNL